MYENELYHYGVKGMKWGVRRYRNEDGSLTEAGKKRLSNKIVRTMAKNPEKTPGDMIDTLKRNPDIKRAHQALAIVRKELDKTMEFESKFYDDPKCIEKYQEKAAKRIGKNLGYDKKDIENLLWTMKNDDADFGHYYSFEEYCRDNKVDPDAYNNERNKAQKQYYNACKEYTQTLLGEYGNSTAWEGYGSSRSVTDVVANTLREMGEEKYYR